jgi:hypothetical protein
MSQNALAKYLESHRHYALYRRWFSFRGPPSIEWESLRFCCLSRRTFRSLHSLPRQNTLSRPRETDSAMYEELSGAGLRQCLCRKLAVWNEESTPVTVSEPLSTSSGSIEECLIGEKGIRVTSVQKGCLSFLLPNLPNRPMFKWKFLYLLTTRCQPSSA